jgi:hypothetical protein
MSATPSCFSGGNHTESVLLHSRETASFQRLRPSSQKRSMDYGLQASRKRHESSVTFLIVGGSKVAGGPRI